MRRNIMLDIDGCIANFNRSFMSYLNQKYDAGRDQDVEPNSYVFEEWGLNINMEEASQRFITSGEFRRVEPYTGAKEFVGKLTELGNVHIVTARIGDFKNKFSPETIEKIKNDTINWFQDNEIPTNGEVIFDHRKVDLCLDKGISIIIDDKLSTALEAAKNGIHAILVNRAWNQHPDRVKVYRSYNFDDVLNIVRKLSQ